jgi:hypothetical protein
MGAELTQSPIYATGNIAAELNNMGPSVLRDDVNEAMPESPMACHFCSEYAIRDNPADSS